MYISHKHTLGTVHSVITDVAGCIHQSSVCLSSSVAENTLVVSLSYLCWYLRVNEEVAEEQHVVVWIKCISVST